MLFWGTLPDLYRRQKVALFGQNLRQGSQLVAYCSTMGGIWEIENISVNHSLLDYIFTSNSVRVGWVISENDCLTKTISGYWSFFSTVVLKQCINNDLETADLISVKFGLDIKFRTGSCLTNESIVFMRCQQHVNAVSSWALPRISSFDMI